MALRARAARTVEDEMGRSGQTKRASRIPVARGVQLAAVEENAVATLESAFGSEAVLSRESDGLVATLAGSRFLVLDDNLVQALA